MNGRGKFCMCCLIFTGVLSAQSSAQSINSGQPRSNGVPVTFTSLPFNSQQGTQPDQGPSAQIRKPGNQQEKEQNSLVNLTNLSSDNVIQLAEDVDNGLISDLLGNEMTSYIYTGMAFLGAILGRPGCDLKAACLTGSLIPAIQGRDIAMVALEPLIPESWKEIYQAARSSMIQGQNCKQYPCL